MKSKKIRESSDGRGQDCFQYQQDGHTFLSCNMRRDQLEQRGSPSELLLDLQSLLHTVESEALRLGQHVLKRKPLLMTQVPQIVPLHPSKSSSSIGSHASVESTLGSSFPTAEQCQDASPLPHWDDFPSVFLPAENKGFEVSGFLSEDIGVSPDEDHPLPWHPPICERLSDTVDGIDDIPGIKERHTLTTRNPDPHAKPYLLKYSVQGVEAEIGQRISTAMKKGVGPLWLLYNLAGLYWRVHGNLYNGVECLRRAVDTAPPEWRDVPLVNLAALLYTAAHIDDALTLTLQAAQIADNEPETNFLLANLYCGKGNLTGAWYHYEQVLAASPGHEQALQYLTALACHTHPPQHNVQPLPTCQNQEGEEDGVCTTDSCPDIHINNESPIVEINEESDLINTDFALGELEENKIDDFDNLGVPKGPEVKINEKELDTMYNEDNSSSIPNPDITIDGSNSVDGNISEESKIEDDPLPDVLLRVRERVASPPPAPHECSFLTSLNKLSDIKHFTSTWLSVSAKNIDISEYLVSGVFSGTQLEEPICRGNLSASMHTLDHLAGVRHRTRLAHFPEMGLREALQTLTDRSPLPVDLMATRIARSLKRNETCWVVATAAALYWRVVGNGERAVDCLRHSLHHAPRHMKDIPLISLANILHRAGLYNNALVVANMALEISPKFVVIHFTMANIYAAKGDLEKAVAFYQSTLALQSSFEPARDRLRAIQCAAVTQDMTVKK